MVEHCPMYRGKNDELVIQYDMNNADRIGLIKFDFLGLKTLTFLQAAEDLISRRHPDDRFQARQAQSRRQEDVRASDPGRHGRYLPA